MDDSNPSSLSLRGEAQIGEWDQEVAQDGLLVDQKETHDMCKYAIHVLVKEAYW